MAWITDHWTAAEEADNSAALAAKRYPEMMQPTATAATPIDIITSVTAIPAQEGSHTCLSEFVRFIRVFRGIFFSGISAQPQYLVTKLPRRLTLTIIGKSLEILNTK